MKIQFTKSILTDTKNGKVNFLKRLANVLEDKGHSIVVGSTPADVALHTVKFDTDRLDISTKKVLRLDGSNVHRKSANAGIAASYVCADGIVYQSEFSKQCAQHYIESEFNLNARKDCVTDIIGNGINIDLQQPKNDKAVIVCSSRWRKHKRLKEMVTSFVETKTQDAMLYVVGTPDYSLAHPQIQYTGELKNAALLDLLKRADVYFHLSWIDNCPNSVVEALGYGIPCIVGNEGGTHELIRDHHSAVCDIEKTFKMKYVDPNHPPEIIDNTSAINSINRLVQERPRLTYKDVAHVDINRVADQYVALFEKVLS